MPAVRGTATAEEGERRRGARGMDSPPQFRRRAPQGGEPRRRAALAGAAAALQVLAAAGTRGKGRGRQWDPFPSLTMDWGAAERASHGGRRRRAELARAAALLRRGGGRAAVEVVVELRERRGGLFIGRVRRWGRGGAVAAGWSAGELRGCL